MAIIWLSPISINLMLYKKWFTKHSLFVNNEITMSDSLTMNVPFIYDGHYEELPTTPA